jgi:hypothetical protein
MVDETMSKKSDISGLLSVFAPYSADILSIEVDYPLVTKVWELFGTVDILRNYQMSNKMA